MARALWVSLAATGLCAQVPDTPPIRIAVLGNPVQQIAWNDEALETLNNLGFNEVQLNIALGFTPV